MHYQRIRSVNGTIYKTEYKLDNVFLMRRRVHKNKDQTKWHGRPDWRIACRLNGNWLGITSSLFNRGFILFKGKNDY